jgi:hypothetical protein
MASYLHPVAELDLQKFKSKYHKTTTSGIHIFTNHKWKLLENHKFEVSCFGELKLRI